MSGFSAAAWQATADIRAAIDALPFVSGLRDGSLSRERFTYYLAQDAHYLCDYARTLAAAAAKADLTDEIAFFAQSARTAIVVERMLHETHVSDISAWGPSPTCIGYTSYLLAIAHTQGYPELVAAILPCFWIYQDVGSRLLAAAGDMTSHPYGDWIATYADKEFAAATDQARRITDRVAAMADPATVERMHTAFLTASRYEWMFWDAAWRQEAWPI
ncbi:TenA family protein [Streptosporangiaceae bacterium NEAU-GS5]|nr:TenA family protein [Streptosporangiaceae bacterium NEAU-GS5]